MIEESNPKIHKIGRYLIPPHSKVIRLNAPLASALVIIALILQNDYNIKLKTLKPMKKIFFLRRLRFSFDIIVEFSMK